MAYIEGEYLPAKHVMVPDASMPPHRQRILRKDAASRKLFGRQKNLSFCVLKNHSLRAGDMMLWRPFSTLAPYQ
ncbi:hypothetical protein [Candidatus Kuenenia stuttgartiensis]|uniref:hypothetical protein n=1 Tax=Kuenenia stuttgartiensis TaxID=174633 RepID=UPI0021BC5F6B|nr:hypothetical protein [Candidatus Kuenenia stuttgartiensis]